MPNESIDDRLLQAQVAIDNTMNDPDVSGPMALYGYDADRMAAGKALYDNANSLHQKQKTEYGEQYEATEALNAKREEAESVNMVHVKVARVALKSEPAAMIKLGLDGKRKVSLSGWLTQARQFYTNALGDSNVLAKLAGFNITQEKLQAGLQRVGEVETANAAQKKETGEAQQATLERDKAMDDLADWIADFRAIARIALADKPQLIEKLGIVEPS